MPNHTTTQKKIVERAEKQRTQETKEGAKPIKKPLPKVKVPLTAKMKKERDERRKVRNHQKSGVPQKPRIDTEAIKPRGAEVSIKSQRPQKREKFEDTHKRITTYVSKPNHRKLNELRSEYRIPITETINEALDDYFKKNGL